MAHLHCRGQGQGTGLAQYETMEFSLNGVELSVNSGNSENLMNH